MCVVSAAMAVILFLDIVTSLNTSNTLIDIWSDVCFLMAGNAILLGNKQSQYRLQFTIKSRPFRSSMNSVHHPLPPTLRFIPAKRSTMTSKESSSAERSERSARSQPKTWSGASRRSRWNSASMSCRLGKRTEAMNCFLRCV